MIQKGQARLITRNGNDWTDRFPDAARALAALPATSAVLDGELVVLTRQGTTSFQALQNVLNSRARRRAGVLRLRPSLPGRDGPAGRLPCSRERKRCGRCWPAATASVRFSDHIVGHGAEFYQQACGMGLEGIICKRADSRYVHKRTRDWLKVKCLLRQEFVIGGYTEPKGSRSHFGALLLGVHDENGDLVYAGKVGTGFDEARLREVHARLRKLQRAGSPFANLGRRGRTPRDVTWIEPELVCEIAFTEWTDEGKIRAPRLPGAARGQAGGRRGPRAPRPPSRGRDGPTRPSAPRPPPTTIPRTRTRPVPPSTQQRAAPARQGGGRGGGGRAHLQPRQGALPCPGHHQAGPGALLRGRRASGCCRTCRTGPLTLVRCPEGVGGDCFYQKHGDQHFHESIGRVPIAENDGDERVYTYVDSVAGLIGMVQMGVLEMHTSNARRQNFERPDRFVIDLDPAPDVPWARTVAAAFQVRDRLEELRLESWVKSTGGKGLHIVVPLARRHGWDEVKDFTKAFSADLSARNPGKYLIKATIAARKGKIFIDYLRNGRGATSIGALCVRAKPTAAISVPLRWDEVSPKLDPDAFTPDAVAKRLAKLKADPWEGYWTSKQSITKAMRTAVGLK